MARRSAAPRTLRRSPARLGGSVTLLADSILESANIERPNQIKLAVLWKYPFSHTHTQSLYTRCYPPVGTWLAYNFPVDQDYYFKVGYITTMVVTLLCSFSTQY